MVAPQAQFAGLMEVTQIGDIHFFITFLKKYLIRPIFSADPESYRKEFLASQSKTDDTPSNTTKASWEYIRVPCLGILPGLGCPHYDQTQSNGLLRADDFEEMMGRHPTEQGFEDEEVPPPDKQKVKKGKKKKDKAGSASSGPSRIRIRKLDLLENNLLPEQGEVLTNVF